MLGGVAGLLAGVLLAPRSGRELRGSIRDRAGEARERSRESLFEAQERMQERISEVREGPDRRTGAPGPLRSLRSPRPGRRRDPSCGTSPAARTSPPRGRTRGRRSCGGRSARPAPASGRTSIGQGRRGRPRSGTAYVRPTSFVPTLEEISAERAGEIAGPRRRSRTGPKGRAQPRIGSARLTQVGGRGLLRAPGRRHLGLRGLRAYRASAARCGVSGGTSRRGRGAPCLRRR